MPKEITYLGRLAMSAALRDDREAMERYIEMFHYEAQLFLVHASTIWINNLVIRLREVCNRHCWG